MKAIVFEDKGKYKLKEVPVPKIGEEDVLIKVDTCGICGTDVHIYEGTFPANFPVIIGHEFSGIIKKVGEKVKNFKIGNAVAVNPNTACGKCKYCRNGKENFCIAIPGLGVNYDGGFAEYVKVRESSVYLLPEKLNLEVASFTEPLSCSLHGIDLAEIKPGHSVIILGAGPIGLIIVLLAKISGADKIIITDPVKKRRELALDFGASLALDSTKVNLKRETKTFLKGKAEVVIECIGNPTTQAESLNLVEPGGRVIWFGVADPKAEIKVNPFYIYRNEITIKGCFVNPYTTERAVRLLGEGKIKVKELITHRFGLNELDEAMQVYRKDKERIKILMKPGKVMSKVLW